MNERTRARMNVRAIQVSLRAALAGHPESRAHAIAIARRLYDQARESTNDPEVRAEIDRLQGDLGPDSHIDASSANGPERR